MVSEIENGLRDQIIVGRRKDFIITGHKRVDKRKFALSVRIRVTDRSEIFIENFYRCSRYRSAPAYDLPAQLRTRQERGFFRAGKFTEASCPGAR